MSEPDVDTEVNYSVSFPLPFRVLVLAGFGILGWATNLHGLNTLGVDAVAALDLKVADRGPRTSQRLSRDISRMADAAPLYRTVYQICIIYSLWCFASWTLYRSLTTGNATLVDEYGYIPGLSALVVALVLVCPFNVFYKHERDKFLRSIKRCMFSSMDAPIYFADVVFADILTSFAKVLGDVWLSFRMLLPGSSLLHLPADPGWLRWVMPTIMSIPYLVRLRQCVVEWTGSNNESRRPLFNAIKYATAFPVMYLSAAQRLVVSELIQEKGDEVTKEAWHGEHPLFRLWLLFAAINSLYSFWWDVTNDWGLELLKLNPKVAERPSPPRRLVLPHLHSGSSLLRDTSRHESVDFDESRRPHPYGLRATLLYPLPVYPLLVFLNLILRLTWSIKLSSHLHSKTEGSITIFMIELAEVLRRWMWVFVRVEWEVIKKATDSRDSPRHGSLSGDESDYEMIPPTPP